MKNLNLPKNTIVIPNKTATVRSLRRMASMQGCTATFARGALVTLLSPRFLVVDGSKSAKALRLRAETLAGCR